MAKPDDRSDNVAKLQDAVQNTIENLGESEHYLDEHSVELSPQETQTLTNKNEKRREAISSLKSEIEDEANVQE
ncbi:small acid-soluble spore protein Tlp [Cohnella sp. WQ 127256]|uniref:small acid-soluble spore protein Tlp n=1 Tax=Cohnella sp. WQ 127256 TaxID=2938790 RepID=UPI002742493A|nr:small acid-soluble spore protein Tlp [Cohnella sp. WQ 127256]